MDPHSPAPGPPVGVPRRFGIGTLLVFILLCSVVSALVPMPGSTILLAAMVVIGLAQMAAGQGQPARRASMAVGAIGMALAFAWFLLAYTGRPGWLSLALGMILYAFIGGCFGYALGAVVAGAFLVSWWIDRALGTARPSPDPGEDRAGEPPPR